jgi:hypothetical protein
MSLMVERRVLSILGSIVGAGVLTTSIVEQWRLHRWLAQASAMGISVDVSPDKFQLELRVALAPHTRRNLSLVKVDESGSDCHGHTEFSHYGASLLRLRRL